MEAPRLTCGFRLYHFAASLKEGGAAASCRGEPRGSAMAADLIKDNVLSAYLGASAPAEQENDAGPRGFAEDSDLQARSAARPEVSRLASANASACRAPVFAGRAAHARPRLHSSAEGGGVEGCDAAAERQGGEDRHSSS